MDERTAKLNAALEQKLACNRKNREQRAAKKKRINPSAALHDEWIVSMRQGGFFLDGEIPKWTAAEFALAKRMVDELGFEKVVEFVRYFIKTWKERRTVVQERRGDMPAVKLCWVLRARVLAEMRGVVNRPKSKRERILRGEYDPESAEISPMEGWGD